MSGQLSESQAAAVLKSMEDDAGLLHLRVCGYSPWRLLRFSAGLALQNLPFQSVVRSKIGLLSACLRSIHDLVRLPRDCQYAVKSFSSALRIRTDAGYEDQYFEALLQSVPGGLRLYSSNAPGHKVSKAAWKGPQVDITALMVAGALLARLFPVKDEQKVFASIAKIVVARLPGERFSEKRIRQIFSMFWWQSFFYEWLLKRIKPSTVIVANTGDYAFLKAAKHVDCRVIELQHGIFTSHHPDALPAAAGCDVDDPGLLLPDVVAAYGEYWINIHAHTLLGRAGRIKPCGASFMERMRAERKRLFAPSSVRVVVTTQGVARDELISFLQDFLRACPAMFALDIKLHPAYDTSTEPYRHALGTDARVRVIAGYEDPDTYQLIAACDLHVSISSACHYDAIGLQVPTVVLALPNHELVLGLVEDGEALLARNGEELARIVTNRSWIAVSGSVSEKYYKNDFSNAIAGWMARA